ncbi:conserved exported hypothetical protein [Rhodospirillaceae bacterium LM-1]|nr:conserved exported hypothetical protein [Rhodospirillaceae bacterium LM-1]
MIVLRRTFALLLCCIFLFGCQQTFRVSERLSGNREAKNRIALMPMDVLLYELTAGSDMVPNAVWTENAKKHLLDGIRSNPAFGNLELVEVPNPPIDSPDAKQLASFMQLHAAVGSAVLAHSYVPAYVLPTKGNKLDWTMGPHARNWRDKVNARYALFLHVEDGYADGGRVALMITAALLFGVAIPGGTQSGFASLVDLETGDVVWFNHIARQTGDLRNGQYAKESVDALFLGFPLGKGCVSC